MYNVHSKIEGTDDEIRDFFELSSGGCSFLHGCATPWAHSDGRSTDRDHASRTTRRTDDTFYDTIYSRILDHSRLSPPGPLRSSVDRPLAPRLPGSCRLLTSRDLAPRTDTRHATSGQPCCNGGCRGGVGLVRRSAPWPGLGMADGPLALNREDRMGAGRRGGRALTRRHRLAAVYAAAPGCTQNGELEPARPGVGASGDGSGNLRR